MIQKLWKRLKQRVLCLNKDETSAQSNPILVASILINLIHCNAYQKCTCLYWLMIEEFLLKQRVYLVQTITEAIKSYFSR